MLTPAPGMDELDSLLKRAFPFQGIFHPVGHAIEIISNSPDPIDEAAKLWRRYPRISAGEPSRISIVTNRAPANIPRNPPLPKIHGRLFSITHGPYDFALADLTAGLAVAFVSAVSIADNPYFRYHFLEPLAYVLLGARHFFYVHASCISRNGRAMLLCGNSGAGKTCLAYACAKRGWDFVSGDAVHIVRPSANHLVGRPYEIRFRESACSLFPELTRFPSVLRPNGKLDIEIDTRDLPIRPALEARPAHVVFIERATETRIDPCSRSFAIAKLSGTICYGDDRTQTEQREALSRISRLPLWCLRYADFDQAERTLRRLLA